MVINIQKAAVPISVVVAAVVLTVGSVKYLASMEARVTEKFHETENRVADKVDDLSSSVELKFHDTQNTLDNIEAAVDRIDSANVKETDLRLWIERARASDPTLPKWENK